MLLVVVLSGTTILTLSVATTNLTIPVIISGAALVVAMIAAVSIMGPSVTGAPWVPTSRKLVTKVLEMAKLKPNELLYDLGSGDGRIVITAARDFGVRTVGIEIDPFRALYSRLKISQLHLKDKARIVRGSFYKIDLRNADVVILYLEQQTNNRLRSKLERELTKPDCRVVSVIFEFEGWQVINQDAEELIHVYKLPSDTKTV